MTSSADRGQWGNQIQFILTCVGYAVGLGNIWRFPYLAYQHGGGAFLIPYIICSLLFGLPMLYLEMSIGQFTQMGPSTAFKLFMPALQGIGWTMTAIAALTGIFYNVIIAWVVVYLYFIFTGQSWKWTRCGNEWNARDNQFCVSSFNNDDCEASNASLPFFFNNTCYANTQEAHKPFLNASWMIAGVTPINYTKSASSQFYENFLLMQQPTMDITEAFNFRVFGALIFVWILTAVSLLWGVKIIGRISYFTATVPYIIITVLFVRAITLDGASIGLEKYITNPDFGKLLQIESWSAALIQVCFSLSIGFGGLLSLSSYNKKTHNCFRDALIVCSADAGMSVIGGTAVFSVLGFMAKQQNKGLDEVVAAGPGLAFIVYPEALSRMPWAGFMSFLFFAMLFLLGVSSQFGLTQGVCVAITDQFPHLRKHNKLVVVCVCAVCFLCGIVTCTSAGIHYFSLLSDYTGSISLCVAILAEIFLITIGYGILQWRKDLAEMLGEPKSTFSKIIGPLGWTISGNWLFIAPLMVLVVFYGTATSMSFKALVANKDSVYKYTLPVLATPLSWLIAILPIGFIFVFLIGNLVEYQKKHRPLRDLFHIHHKHPSYKRIMEKEKQPPPPTSNVYQIHPDDSSLEMKHMQM